MPTDWSDSILLAELADEPQLSEELGSIIDRITKGAVRNQHVVLNFANVRYVSSSHLAQLVRLRTALTQCKRQLVICSVTDNVWSVFLMTGLDRLFRFAPDPLTALATIQLEAEPEGEASR